MAKSRFICVKCGKEATEGSMKQPYCKKCFKRIWNNDYNKYMNQLGKIPNNATKRIKEGK